MTDKENAEIIEYSKLDPQALMTTAQVADWLKVSESYFNKARHTGEGPKYVKIGAAVRYSKRAMDDWIAEKQRQSTRMGYALTMGQLPEPWEIEEWLSAGP